MYFRLQTFYSFQLERQELLKVLLSFVEDKIEMFIDNEFYEFSFYPYVRGFHVYKDVWSLFIGEENLDCKHEEGNEYYKYAGAVYTIDLINEM